MLPSLPQTRKMLKQSLYYQKSQTLGKWGWRGKCFILFHYTYLKSAKITVSQEYTNSFVKCNFPYERKAWMHLVSAFLCFYRIHFHSSQRHAVCALHKQDGRILVRKFTVNFRFGCGHLNFHKKRIYDDLLRQG